MNKQNDKYLYVIESGEYSDFDYYGVYDTKEEAENVILFIINKIHEKYNLEDYSEYPIFESYKDYLKWKEIQMKNNNWSYYDNYWINEVILNRMKDKELEFDTGIKPGEFHKRYREWKLKQFKKKEQGHNVSI